MQAEIEIELLSGARKYVPAEYVSRCVYARIVDADTLTGKLEIEFKLKGDRKVYRTVAQRTTEGQLKPIPVGKEPK
jgi:hypothetical protein